MILSQLGCTKVHPTHNPVWVRTRSSLGRTERNAMYLEGSFSLSSVSAVLGSAIFPWYNIELKIFTKDHSLHLYGTSDIFEVFIYFVIG